MLTYVHKVVNTCWCWHICKGGEVWFDAFVEAKRLFFHCAGGEETEVNGGHWGDRTLDWTWSLNDRTRPVGAPCARIVSVLWPDAVARPVVVHLTCSVARGCLLETTGRWHCGVHCEVLSRPDLAHGAWLGLTSASGQSWDQRVPSTTVRGGTRERATRLYCHVRSCRAVSPVDLCWALYHFKWPLRSNVRDLKYDTWRASDGRGGAAGRCGHPVRPDRRVWSPWFVLCSEPNDSIRRGLLYKLVGRLLLFLLAICIDIATLWV
jgi:hypothetical protein